MNLNHIKDMGLKNIGKQFKNMELRQSTERHSLASRNISKGLFCEKKVMHYFAQYGWTLINHRVNLKFSETDLIFKKENKIKLVEVKSLHSEWMVFQRVNQNQINNMIKNMIDLKLRLKSKYEFECSVCYVLNNKEVIEVAIE